LTVTTFEGQDVLPCGLLRPSRRFSQQSKQDKVKGRTMNNPTVKKRIRKISTLGYVRVMTLAVSLIILTSGLPAPFQLGALRMLAFHLQNHVRAMSRGLWKGATSQELKQAGL
jgi:hypothetical protein